MAVTKIKPIKGTLKKAFDYIEDPDKTDGKLLISSYGCSYETADIEFAFTLSKTGEKGGNLAHHLIQSFSPEDNITPETAHEIGKKLADKITGGKYEYVLTTHTDKNHIHNHLIFCAADFVEHKRYVSNKKSYYAIRKASDMLCREYGLSVVEPENNVCRREYYPDKKEISYKSALRKKLDLLIPQCNRLEEVLDYLQNDGYEIKRGKYISIRSSSQLRFTRLKSLGGNYTEKAICERICGNGKNIDLIIDIQNSIKAQENKGYAHWAKIHNAKQVAQTIEFLTKHDIDHIDKLKNIIDITARQMDNIHEKRKESDKKLSDIRLLIKHVSAIIETKTIYDAYRKNKNSQKYRTHHEREIIIYEASVKAIHALGFKTIPSLDQLKQLYINEKQHRDLLYQEYAELKETLKKYETVRHNVEEILSVKHKDTSHEKEKKHQHELE